MNPIKFILTALQSAGVFGLHMDSGGGGGGSATSTQVTDIPDWAKPYAKEILGKGQALTQTPYQTYDKDRQAGFSPLQEQSFQGAANLQPSRLGARAGEMADIATQRALGTGYDPYQAVNQFQSTGGYSPEQFGNQFQAPSTYAPTQTGSQYQGVSNYAPSQFGNRFQAPQGFDAYQAANQYQDVGAYTPSEFRNQFQAPTSYEAGQFATERVGGPQLQQYQMGPAERVRADTFGGAQAAQYMSPYLEQAMAPQLREAQRASEIQGLGEAASAVRSGAFGGSRQAIVEAERQRNLAQQQGDIRGKGYQAAYEQAASQFSQDAARRLQAQLANQQAGLTTGTQNLAASLGIQQLGAQTGLQAQLANQQQAMEAQRLAEQSRQFGAGQGLTAAQLQAQYGLSSEQAAEASKQFAKTREQEQAATRAQYGQAGQQLAEQSRQFGAGQGLTAAQLQAQYGLSADQAAEASKQFAQTRAQEQAATGAQYGEAAAARGEQSRQFGAGQTLTAAQLQAQYGLSAQQAQEAANQFAKNKAIEQASLGAQYGQSAQQLAEQSRQYGAGLGLDALRTAFTGAGQMGQLGGQQFAQYMDINKLQNLYGGQQQAQTQAGMTQQYQDFLNQQRYPYQQLEYLSGLMRGTPMGTVNTMYQPAPSMGSQIAGLGTAAYGASRMFKKGGAVKRGPAGGLAALAIDRIGRG